MSQKTQIDDAIDWLKNGRVLSHRSEIIRVLRAAKRDEKRLSWMEKYCYVMGWTYGKINMFKKNGKLKKITFRQVIDKAIRKEKKSK